MTDIILAASHATHRNVMELWKTPPVQAAGPAQSLHLVSAVVQREDAALPGPQRSASPAQAGSDCSPGCPAPGPLSDKVLMNIAWGELRLVRSPEEPFRAIGHGPRHLSSGRGPSALCSLFYSVVLGDSGDGDQTVSCHFKSAQTTFRTYIESQKFSVSCLSGNCQYFYFFLVFCLLLPSNLLCF